MSIFTPWLCKANVSVFVFSSILSWSSFSASWLECWGKETPTRLATRSCSAPTTALPATLHRPAPATHLHHPLTTSSECDPEGGRMKWEQPTRSNQWWVIRRKQGHVRVQHVCVWGRRWKRDISRLFLRRYDINPPWLIKRTLTLNSVS